MPSVLISVSPMLLQNASRICVYLPYDQALIQKIRTVPGARRSALHRCWHMPKTAEVWRQLRKLFGAIEMVDAGPQEGTPA